MKQRIAAVLTVMILALPLFMLTASAEQSGITGLKAIPYSATQIKVSWKGTDSVYNVNYGPVNGSFYYYDTVYTNSAIISVAPDTDYAITVEPEGGEATDPVFVTTPRISSTREYGYKYQNFSLYYVNAGTNQDFWEDASRTRVERIQGAMLASAGDLRNFHATVEFTLASANVDKDLNYIIVLYPPNSPDRFTTSDMISVPANWTYASWALGVDYIFTTYLNYNDSFAPGRYALELYFNGWLGGKTTFIVE